jgi:spoIIIJ-associated protein
MSDEKQENRSRRSEEFRGKTVEAAVSAGLAAWHVERDQVEIEVVKAGSRGVLGIGAEDAIVRLSALPGPEAAQVPGQAPAKVAEPRPKSKTALTPAPAEDRQQAPSKAAKPRGDTAAARRGERAPEPRAEQPANAEASAAQASPKGGVAGAGDDKSSVAVSQGKELLQGLVDRMNLRARVEVVAQSDAEADEGERVQVLNIVGEDLGVLIGRQNEVLSALELITRLMVNQRVHARSDFIVDVNGYRAKRAESLRKLALRMAEQAVETGRTEVLEPMPPAERRIVHLALRDHPKVTTQSVGEGDRRKVTIVPKRD